MYVVFKQGLLHCYFINTSLIITSVCFLYVKFVISQNMENKTVILSVLIVMSLIMAQTQVDAKSCCPSKASRQAFNTCRIIGTPAFACEATTGCKIVWSSCPEGYNNHAILENSGKLFFFLSLLQDR